MLVPVWKTSRRRSESSKASLLHPCRAGIQPEQRNRVERRCLPSQSPSRTGVEVAGISPAAALLHNPASSNLFTLFKSAAIQIIHETPARNSSPSTNCVHAQKKVVFVVPKPESITTHTHGEHHHATRALVHRPRHVARVVSERAALCSSHNGPWTGFKCWPRAGSA